VFCSLLLKNIEVNNKLNKLVRKVNQIESRLEQIEQSLASINHQLSQQPTEKNGPSEEQVNANI